MRTSETIQSHETITIISVSLGALQASYARPVRERKPQAMDKSGICAIHVGRKHQAAFKKLGGGWHIPPATHTHTQQLFISFVSPFPMPYLSGSGILVATTALCQDEKGSPREQDADKRKGCSREINEDKGDTRHTHIHSCNTGVVALTLPHTRTNCLVQWLGLNTTNLATG